MNNKNVLLLLIINIISSTLVIITGLMGSKQIYCISNTFMKSKNIDITIADFISSSIKYGMIFSTIIFSLKNVGITSSTIMTAVGAISLTAGMALQQSLSNFAAGVLLVSFRYFKIGDYVDLGGVLGIVISIQIFSTKLRALDGKIVIIPNSKILSNNIINFSKESFRLFEMIISVEYTSNITKVKNLLINILESDDNLLNYKGVKVKLKSFDAISLNFSLSAWFPRKKFQNISSNLLEKIKKSLDTNNIVLSYAGSSFCKCKKPIKKG